MGVKFGRVRIWFKKGNMKNGVKTRKIRRKTETICRLGDSVVNREWAKTAMIKLVRGTGGFDVSTKEPNQLIRLVRQCF